ncbi:MAG: sulfite exporter TauE/SafE family protein [Sedimentisphaerales bacterium]|nr:sulfite exporter TauE/SafE family protein [Sedimentisphaerales bacterium]
MNGEIGQVLELDMVQCIVLGLCAVMVGISKTGIPGVGILCVPLFAWVLPARTSVGVALGILILADVFSASYYRRHAEWRFIRRLLPAAFVGIVAGYFSLKYVDDEQLQPVIGVIVLIMLAVEFWQNRSGDKDQPVLKQAWFTLAMGFCAGVTTMMANAAGPVMMLYLLSMRLPKKEFVGTAAWFFFVINWIKVPFSVNLGLMTRDTIKLDLFMLPCIAAGALAGIYLLKKIPQHAFVFSVRILTVIAAVKLIFW